jgi:predicted nucleic acid-binding Zn ribbon protein
MAKARRPSLTPLPDVLARVLKAHGMQTPMLEYSLQQRWTDIVGEHIGRHTWPESIRHRKLYLVTENSVWLQQLRFLKPEILAKITTATEGEPLTDIVMRVGALPSAEAEESRSPQPVLQAGSGECAADLQAAIDASVRPVADPDLRERLRTLLMDSLKAPPKKS